MNTYLLETCWLMFALV